MSSRYILRRLGQAVLVLFVVSIAAVILVRLVPGDPARVALGPHASQPSLASLRRQLGLDGSVVSQYLHYVGQLAHGNLGFSITQTAPVSALVLPRIVPSLLLIGYAMVVAVVIAVPLGLSAARHKNRPLDHGIRAFSTVTMAMPTFWLGVFLALVFGVWLKVLPTSGYGTTLAQHIESLTLPAIAVGALVAPLLLRTLRSSASEALSAEYTEACRARGLSERRVLYRHVLRNSLIAFTTVLGVSVAWLLSFTVAAENVFAIPGLGSLLVTSVNQTDYPTIQALILVFGVVVVIVNFATDLAYARLDPKVKL